MLVTVKSFGGDLFSLFYPNLCIGCRKALLSNEHLLCLRCADDLPVTNHFTDPDNQLIKRFAGRVPVKGAAALLHFSKHGPVQQLLHELKYRGQTEVGTYFGQLAAYQLRQSYSVVPAVDIVVPVPLHWKKQRVRGYNQCDSFAQAIAEGLAIDWTTEALERVHENISQTKQSRFDRYGNVANIFGLKKPELLQGKHVLLVDDVFTTGATSEACLNTILQVPGTMVSFVSIAAAVR